MLHLQFGPGVQVEQKKMLGIIDHILALYPFEPDYMKAVGIDCDFVGHTNSD